MYINLELMYSYGINPDELIRLIAINQRSTMFPSEPYETINKKLISLELAEHKKGKIMITNKGLSFLTNVSMMGVTTTVIDICNKATGLYEQHLKDSGKILDVQNRMAWFIGETGFSDTAILRAIEEHLNTSGTFTMSLPNLIWKPQSVVFSVKKTLTQSKLFDIISTMYNINVSKYMTDNVHQMYTNKTREYIFELNKLPSPTRNVPPEYTFTGNIKSDAEKLKEIKNNFFKHLQSYDSSKF